MSPSWPALRWCCGKSLGILTPHLYQLLRKRSVAGRVWADNFSSRAGIAYALDEEYGVARQGSRRSRNLVGTDVVIACPLSGRWAAAAGAGGHHRGHDGGKHRIGRVGRDALKEIEGPGILFPALLPSAIARRQRSRISGRRSPRRSGTSAKAPTD